MLASIQKSFFISTFAIILLGSFLWPSVGQAQQAPTTTPPVPSLPVSEAIGPLNCFDYYTFGSVQADLQSTVAQTVPGSTITFAGDLNSTNPYPLLDGTLYVKIFHRNETTFAEGDGNEVVDQFVIKEGLTVPANGTIPMTYTWKAPLNAEAGEYYAAYFFTTAKRYNLMGLSFTDDVVGNQAPFTITNPTDPKLARLSKVDTTLNDRNHHFAAYPLHFKADEKVTVETTITNPTDKPKSIPLQWNQYAWDGMNKDNLRYTKTELVTLAPNETKTISYEARPQKDSVVYITAVAQDKDAKSFLNIRYVVDGLEETRINFPGLTAFPLEQNKEQTLFACAHSTNQPLVSGNILKLSLKDKDGNVIHEYKYEGDIAGAMSGFGDTFTPTKNINYATLTATLERSGVVVEEVTQTYDCAAIDQASCLPETSTTDAAADFLTKHLLTIILTVLSLLIIASAIFYIKKRKNGIDDGGGMEMTTPIAVLFFLLMLPSLFFLPQQTEAKSVSWSKSENLNFGYCWNFSRETINNGACDGWAAALQNPSFTISYAADVYNADTNSLLADGSSIPVGTKIKFVPKTYQDSDIYWFGTGYASDSPNGHWISGATAPARQCIAQDFVGNDPTYGTLGVYIPLSVNPPSNSVSTGGTAALADLGGNTYQVNSTGSISGTVTFASTQGILYYRYLENNTSCFGNNIPLKQGGAIVPTTGTQPAVEYCINTGYSSSCTVIVPSYTYSYNQLTGTLSDYTLNVPAQSITFNFTATAPAVNGSCNNATNNSCSTGTLNDTADSGTQYLWQCVGSGGGSTDSCALNKPVVGSCNNTTNNACYAGTLNNIADSGTHYLWNCNGQYGGGNASCSLAIPASPVNGSCNNTVNNGCYAGSWGDTTDTSTHYLWNCNGQNGGSPASCSLAKPVVNGSCNNTTNNACYSGTLNNTADSGTHYLWSCNGSGGGGNDSCSLLIPVPNQAPTIPTISGSCTSGLPTTLTLTSTDPDGNTLRYGVDWDNNGSLDEWIPGSGYVNSGTAQTATRTWFGAGPHSYRVMAQDSNGNSTAWSPQSIACAVPPPTTVDLKINGSDGPTISVNSGDTINLSWTVANVSSCSVYGAGWSSDPLLTTNAAVTVTNPDTYILQCVGTDGSTYTDSIDVVISTPPTAKLEVTTDNGATWQDVPSITVAPNANVDIRWSSTDAPTCTGTATSGGFDVSGPSGTDTDIPLPGSGGTNFTLDCAGATDQLLVTVALPNFNQPLVRIDDLGTFNATDGTYSDPTIFFSTANNGSAPTNADATYTVEITGCPTQSGTIPSGLAVGPAGFSRAVTMSTCTVALGSATAKVSVDTPIATNGSVAEVTEGEADNTRTINFDIPPPDPGLNLTATRYQVRHRETSTLKWTIADPYAGLSCQIFGPNLNLNDIALPSGSNSTAPINAKSEFTLKCTAAGTTWTDTINVETTGTIEEI